VNQDRPTAKTYRRALAAANEKFGWAEIPDCPMEIFARILGEREQGHPEAEQQPEQRGRVFSERAWNSAKLRKVQPATWIPEYAWLVSIAYIDGTFKYDAQDIWAKAYSCNRADWTPDQVAQLLAEFERVGLLVRKTDEHGTVWGFWIGADEFSPPPSRWKHYKTAGKRKLFGDVQPRASQGLTFGQQEVEVELESEKEREQELELELATKQQQKEQVKSESLFVSSSKSNTVVPKPEDFTCRLDYGAACKTSGVLPVPRAVFKKKDVLPATEYQHAKITAELENTDMDAERLKRGFEPCSDGTWRLEVVRAVHGFTVKGENGVWNKVT